MLGAMSKLTGIDSETVTTWLIVIAVFVVAPILMVVLSTGDGNPSPGGGGYSVERTYDDGPGFRCGRVYCD